MTRKNIVILGAGFSGAAAALALARGIGKHRDEYEITLIDRYHHQLYTPALYEIAAIPAARAPRDTIRSAVLIPLADITARRNIALISDECIGIRTDGKKVLLRRSGELPYEFLIVALGSETNYFGIPGLAEHSFPLKTFDDAQRLRAALEKIAAEKSRARVIVGGAGASGVEVAAEFVNFFCAIQKDKSHTFPRGIRPRGKVWDKGVRKPVCNGDITLVEAGLDILPGFDAWTVERSKKRLHELGVAIRTGRRIRSVSKNEITYQDGAASAYDVLVWTGGVKGSVALESCGLPLSDKGTLITDEYLRVAGGNDAIFAVGDNAAVKNPETTGVVIGNVPVALAEARIAARNILAVVRGRKKQQFLPQKRYPFVLALGKKYAIADLTWIRTAGFLGWCVKQAAELRYLLSILPFRKTLSLWRLGIKIYASND